MREIIIEDAEIIAITRMISGQLIDAQKIIGAAAKQIEDMCAEGESAIEDNLISNRLQTIISICNDLQGQIEDIETRLSDLPNLMIMAFEAIDSFE